MKGVKTRAEGELLRTALALLEELGPQTSVEIAREQGVSRDSAANSLSRLHDRGRVHIHDWTLEVEGVGRRTRAIYAAGQGEDKPKPPRETNAEKKRRLYKRNKGQINSVFQLGRKALRRLVDVPCR